MKKIILTTIVTLGLFSTTLTASMQEAMYKAKAVARVLQHNGYTLKKAGGGYLGNKQTQSFYITLYKGNTYKFVGVGDSRVKDLDVEIFDENGHRVVKDKKSDAVPVARVTPKWSGTFLVKYKMYNGHGNYVQISAFK